MTDQNRNIDEIVDDESQWGEPRVGKTRERKETVVSVRLPLEVAEAARERAREMGETLSSWAREAIANALQPRVIFETCYFHVSQETQVSFSKTEPLADAASA